MSTFHAELDPCRIRFTHARVRPVFSGCGRRLDETLAALACGRTSVAALPTITVIRNGGLFVSLNNRRLYVLQQLRGAGLLPGGVVRVRVKEANAREAARYTAERCAETASVMLEHEPASALAREEEREAGAESGEEEGGGAAGARATATAAGVAPTASSVEAPLAGRGGAGGAPAASAGEGSADTAAPTKAASAALEMPLPNGRRPPDADGARRGRGKGRGKKGKRRGSDSDD